MPIPPLDQDLTRRAEALRWLLFDIDGVLTDGRLWYTGEGETIKPFHVRDGLGLKLAQKAGLSIGLFSGRRSPPVEARARELGFDAWILGSGDKRADFAAFLEEKDMPAEAVAFIGDDLVDVPVLRCCGLAFAPADAVAEVRAVVHRVLSVPGGAGVARELVEMVLRARGEWDAIIEPFLREE